MKKLLLAAPLGALLLAACHDIAPPPGPAPGPEPVRFTGRILDRAGPCNTIRSFRTGRLYSVRPRALRDIPPGTVVRVRGFFAGRRGCPHPMIRVRGIRPI
ncbi:MAG: hypothetical protein RLT05_24205 [Bauldia litoralis]